MQVLHFPRVTLRRATEAAQLKKGICVQMQTLHRPVESSRIQTRPVQQFYINPLKMLTSLSPVMKLEPQSGSSLCFATCSSLRPGDVWGSQPMCRPRVTIAPLGWACSLWGPINTILHCVFYYSATLKDQGHYPSFPIEVLGPKF